MKRDIIETEINVNNNRVGIKRVNNIDFISITDIAKYANSREPSEVIRNWMSNKNSFEFYSLWEELKLMKFHTIDLL